MKRPPQSAFPPPPDAPTADNGRFQSKIDEMLEAKGFPAGTPTTSHYKGKGNTEFYVNGQYLGIIYVS